MTAANWGQLCSGLPGWGDPPTKTPLPWPIVDAIWPHQAVDIDVMAAMADEPRLGPNRPWVTMMMISSIDGAAALEGVSGPLGAPSDKSIFAALRSLTDAVVVGAGTARDENYRPIPLRSSEVQQQRSRRGQQSRPMLAVVSGSLSFGPDTRLFSDPDAPPLLYTVSDLDAAVRNSFADRADVVVAGDRRVDPARVVADLGERGCRHLLLEGGPRLNADFLAAGLVDEIHLSLAPVTVSAPAPRIVEGRAGAVPHQFALDRVWTGDGLLFLRYVRS